MSAIVTGNSPLNHYLTEVPEKKFFSLKCKALAFNVLEKISYVAILAIMATALTVFHTGIVLTGVSAYLMAGAIFSLVILYAVTPSFIEKANTYSKKAEEEGHVALKLKEIAHWKTAEVEQFLRDEGLDPTRIPLEPLKQINKEQPLTALLPLIARFLCSRDEADRLEKDSESILNEPVDSDSSRWFQRNVGWDMHEREAIPTAIKAALLLQMIRQPTKNFGLENVGTIKAKPFHARMFDKLYLPKNEHYFIFHKDLKREPLTLPQIEQNMKPRALRLMLFPNRV